MGDPVAVDQAWVSAAQRAMVVSYRLWPQEKAELPVLPGRETPGLVPRFCAPESKMSVEIHNENNKIFHRKKAAIGIQNGNYFRFLNV